MIEFKNADAAFDPDSVSNDGQREETLEWLKDALDELDPIEKGD